MDILMLGTGHGACEKERHCSGILLKTGDNYYLIDAGAPVESMMVKRDIPVSNIKATFITHMHEDHCTDVVSVVKCFSGYQDKKTTDIYMPEQNGIDALKTWCNALHMHPDQRVNYHLITDGCFYDDGVISVTSIKNSHLKDYPSYSFVIKVEGKNILFSGDLTSDLRDFQSLQNGKYDCVFMELTHYKVNEHVGELLGFDTKKMIFNHISPYNIRRYNLCKDQFPYETIITTDGMEFSL